MWGVCRLYYDLTWVALISVFLLCFDIMITGAAPVEPALDAPAAAPPVGPAFDAPAAVRPARPHRGVDASTMFFSISWTYLARPGQDCRQNQRHQPCPTVHERNRHEAA